MEEKTSTTGLYSTNCFGSLQQVQLLILPCQMLINSYENMKNILSDAHIDLSNGL